MSNILEAIVNITESKINNLKNHYSSKNRINNIGEALETFIKYAFANCININNENEKLQKYNEVFSWLGNQNNPPDIMIKAGDAIEVKKTQSANSDLALNSSYPKASVKANSNMIVQACKNCEDWVEKDLIYCVGHTTDETLKSLWLVYGNIYAAQSETYEIIKRKITEGINQIPHIELATTNELGRVNKVDPLGITNLRIRGMWHIQNPRKVFDYLYQSSSDNEFEMIAIIPLEKYHRFPKESIKKIEKSDVTIQKVKVKNPNNPVLLIDCNLITFVKKNNHIKII